MEKLQKQVLRENIEKNALACEAIRSCDMKAITVRKLAVSNVLSEHWFR